MQKTEQMKSKWFYPLQAEAKKLIDERYDVVGYFNWQEVGKDRVIEHFTARHKDLAESVFTVVCVMHRTKVIEFYEWSSGIRVEVE